MKSKLIQGSITVLLLLGLTAYVGSRSNVKAQSTAASQAIVNTTVCSLAANSTCTQTILWPSNFADSNYAGTCTISYYSTSGTFLEVFTAASVGPTTHGNQYQSQTASSVTLYVKNFFDQTVTTKANCIGVHN